MIRGKGWNDIIFDVFILILICIIFTLANILALKKYRKI
jgi:ABC-2 type transport system permease protein